MLQVTGILAVFSVVFPTGLLFSTLSTLCRVAINLRPYYWMQNVLISWGKWCVKNANHHLDRTDQLLKELTMAEEQLHHFHLCYQEVCVNE